MYAGFKLEIDDIFTQYREKGQKMYDDQKALAVACCSESA